MIYSIIVIVAVCAIGLVVFLFVKKDSFYQQVEEALKTGDYEKARRLCEKRIDSQPHDFVVKYYLGEAYEGLKNYGEAIMYYEKACITASASEQVEIKTQLFMKTAELYRKMKKYPSALGYYALVLDKEPQNSRALFACGEMLYEDKSLTKARSYLERLIQVQPDHLRGRFILGKIYAHLRLLQEAAKQLEEIYESERLGQDAFRDSVTMLLTDVYIGMKNYQKAIDLLRTLLENENYYEEIVVKITETQIMANMINEAQETIKTHIGGVSRARKGELLYFQGNAYFKSSQYFKAIQSWEEAYKIVPDYKDLNGIMNEYAKIVRNPLMEYVFTDDLGKVDVLIHKLAAPETISRTIKTKSYWAYKAGDFVYVLYRYPMAVNQGDMAEIGDLVLTDFKSTAAYNLFSLFGIANEAGDVVSRKNINLISDISMIKFVTDKMK